MVVKRTTLVSTRWDLIDLDAIEVLVKTPLNPNATFKSTSEAIRECAKAGVKIHNYKEMMKDPEKADEFRQKMAEFMKNEEVFEWVDTLDNNQIDGFLMALQMKKDKRYEVKSLV